MKEETRRLFTKVEIRDLTVKADGCFLLLFHAASEKMLLTVSIHRIHTVPCFPFSGNTAQLETSVQHDSKSKRNGDPFDTWLGIDQ
jgi:hypothetical protein